MLALSMHILWARTVVTPGTSSDLLDFADIVTSEKVRNLQMDNTMESLGLTLRTLNVIQDTLRNPNNQHHVVM